MFRIKRSLCVFDIGFTDNKVTVQRVAGTSVKAAVMNAIGRSEQVLSQLSLSPLETNGEGTLMDYYTQKGWTVLRLVPVLQTNDQGVMQLNYQEEEL